MNCSISFSQPCETGGSEEAHEKNFVEQPARAMKSCLQTQFRKLFLHKKRRSFFHGSRTERCGTGCSVVEKGQVSRSCLTSLQSSFICFIFWNRFFFFFFMYGCLFTESQMSKICIFYTHTVVCACWAHVWITPSHPRDYPLIGLSGGVGGNLSASPH